MRAEGPLRTPTLAPGGLEIEEPHRRETPMFRPVNGDGRAASRL